MGIAAPVTQEDHAMKTAFDAGWDGAFEEAIAILETAEHEGKTLADAIKDVRQYRDESC